MKSKPELRHEAWRLRKSLGPEFRQAAAQRIMRQILALPEIEQARRVAIYSSYNYEVDTHALIPELIRRKDSVCLPRVLPGERWLEFRRVHEYPGACQPGYATILEPQPGIHIEVVTVAALDLLLMPGLMFDRRGYRLGYGGGFFDRVLAVPHCAPAIALSFEAMVVDEIPHDPWDRPVDAICTEAGLIRCTSGLKALCPAGAPSHLSVDKALE